MAVTYGFYNALNHDRLYDAIQMSSIFDGIIQDGIFSTIGTSMIVTAPEDGMFVDVGPGRAWFNHTWTLNDTEYPVEAEEAEVVLDRIDAVILEVNAAAEVRANSIKFLKGTPSSNPVKPTLTHNAEVNQYALAYVTIRAGQTTIFQSDIENVVGTDETPFVTGLLQQVSVEQLLLQWNDDFYRYFAAFQAHNNAEFNTWMEAKVVEYNEWYAAMEAEGAHDLETFDIWFQHMKDQLDEDAAGHLQAEIDELAEACEKGSVFTVTTEESTLIGRSCVISQGVESVTKQFDANGVAAFPSMPYIGTIHVEATDGDNVAQGSMNIPYFGRYTIDIAFWAATLNISTSADGLIGRPITITKGGVVVGTTSFNQSGRATYKVHEAGTYIVSSSTAGGDEYAATVVVTEETAYPVNLGIPSGATATPTDDIQTWLKCASIYDKSYTLLADVLEDYYTCERLFSDSNACDYMARSSSWAAVITADASVMEQIGKYDYCCSKLLSNATWAAAIIASDYADYIISFTSVPKMTGANTPSGEASAGNIYGSGYAGWKVFDRATSAGDGTYWFTTANPPASNRWVQYDFGFDIILTEVQISNNGTSSNRSYFVRNFKIQGSSDGVTFTDIYSGTADNSKNWPNYDKHVINDNSTPYRYYRLLATSTYTDGFVLIEELQFIGYIPHINPTVDIIHSAAYDTIYYYDANSVERQLCVTDENGNGTVDWSEMEPGIYTFYSTVAKNPDNLSEEYSRTVKITRTTTEVYLMPPGTFYWNGFEDSELEICSTANGWVVSSRTHVSPTFNPNYIHCDSSSGSSDSMVGSKRERTISLTSMIANPLEILSNEGGEIAIKTVKGSGGSGIYKAPSTTGIQKVTLKPDSPMTGYLYAGANNGRDIDIYTLGILIPRSVTLYSAANDTVYYIDENQHHVTFAVTDETGAASVDLGLIPQGTYTLYSTIAKDPDNLSNPYSKTITIGPDTKSIKVMPDGALYWYGWKGFSTTRSITYNGFSGYSLVGEAIAAFEQNRLSMSFSLSNKQYRSSVFVTDEPFIDAGDTIHCIGSCNTYNNNEICHRTNAAATRQDTYVSIDTEQAYNGSYRTLCFTTIDSNSGSGNTPTQDYVTPSTSVSMSNGYIYAIFKTHDS